jgi:hypothetical protein
MSLWTKTWSNNADAETGHASCFVTVSVKTGYLLASFFRSIWQEQGFMTFDFPFNSTWVMACWLPNSEVTNFRARGWALRVSASNDTQDYFWRREFAFVPRERPANCIVHLEMLTAGHTVTVLCSLSERFCVPQVCGALDMPSDQLTVTASLTYEGWS